LSRPTVFISYRREDAVANAGRLFDWLVREFGHERIFLDTDKIAWGEDFPRVLEERLAASAVLLAVIGPEWLMIADERGRRLDQPDDYVRREIAAAIELGKRVIPVLVDGARMPRAEELPAPLAALASRNAATIDETKFDRDFDFLVDHILGRRRGWARRKLDWFERTLHVAKWSSLVVPLIVAAVAIAVWTRLLDFFTLDTKVASYLMWAADAVSGPGPEPPVVIAAIDEATEQKLGRRFRLSASTDWRRDYARLIDRAAAAGATAVAFDIALERGSEVDVGLAAAAREARTGPSRTRVVFGVRTIADGQPRLVAPVRDAVEWGSLCISRRLGYTFAVPLAVTRPVDPRAPERRRTTDVVSADTPALALAAAYAEPLEAVDLSRREIVLDGPPPVEPPRYSAIERIRSGGECQTFKRGDEVAMLIIRPSRPGYWRDPARRYSFADLLDPAVVPHARLRGTIVLVGVTAPSETGRRRDVHEVVRGFGFEEVYGVELHADAIANLVTARVVRTPTVGLQVAIVLAMAAAGAAASVYTAMRGRASRRLILAGAVVLYVLVAVAMAGWGLLLNLLYDLAAFLVAYVLLRRLQARRAGAAQDELPPWAPSRA
jgi:CHASE2 domain-containing sensor protein